MIGQGGDAVSSNRHFVEDGLEVAHMPLCILTPSLNPSVGLVKLLSTLFLTILFPVNYSLPHLN